MMNLQFIKPGFLQLNILLDFMAAFYQLEGITFDKQKCERALRLLIENPENGVIRLVKLDAEYIGYFAVCFGFSLEYLGRDAFLDEIFLVKTTRGKGIGTRCMTEIETLCRMHGVNALHLEVERENHLAQAYYKKSGFANNDRFLLTKRLL